MERRPRLQLARPPRRRAGHGDSGRAGAEESNTTLTAPCPAWRPGSVAPNERSVVNTTGRAWDLGPDGGRISRRGARRHDWLAHAPGPAVREESAVDIAVGVSGSYGSTAKSCGIR